MNADPDRPADPPAPSFAALHPYDRQVYLRVYTLDDRQVEVVLSQIADRWRLPDDAPTLAPRDLLVAKLQLERLMRDPAAALTDLDQLLDYCFGVGPGPAEGAPGFAINPWGATA